jgi:hypothetical protein
MSRLAERWERLWFASVPPHVYALLRIAFGLVQCGTLLGLRDLSAFWSLDGLVPLDVGAVGLKQLLIMHGVSHAAGWLVYLSTVVSFVAMTIGFQTRLAVPAALFASLLQLRWNYLPLSGADDAMRVFLFCLVWADCGSVWSLDAWLAARRSGASSSSVRPIALIAPLRLIRYQVALIYFTAGLWKIFNPYWRDGSAVHYVVQSNVYRRWPHGMPVAFDSLVSILTYATLAWELTFAFFVLFAPTRRIALLTGILIHLGMLSTIEIGPFHFVMLASYLSFLKPDDVPRLPHRIVALFKRQPVVPPLEPVANR